MNIYRKKARMFKRYKNMLEKITFAMTKSISHLRKQTYKWKLSNRSTVPYSNQALFKITSPSIQESEKRHH